MLALERNVRVDPLAFAVAAPLRSAPTGSSAWWLPVAAAAALIVGMALPNLFARNESPTLAMIHSHFNHAQFSGLNAPPAKVIYARDRSWYYVIVEGAHRYGVVGVGNGGSVEIGTTQPKGETSELFVRNGRPFDRVELRDGERTIEAASIR